MLRIFATVICFFFSLSSFYSQDVRKVDSLNKLLTEHNLKNSGQKNSGLKVDTVTAYLLIQLSKEHWGSDPKSAIEFANKALAISTQINFKRGIALSYQCMGAANEDLGDYNAALDYYEKALLILKERDDKKGISSTYNNIGIIYYHQADFPRALNKFLEALRIQEAMNDEFGMANGNLNVGAVYVEEGSLDKALVHFEIAVKIFEKIGKKEGVALTFNNIGAVYKNLGQFEKAIEHFNIALAINKEIGDKKGWSRCLNNLGETYRTLKDNPSAFRCFSEALKIKEEIGDVKGIASINNNMAMMYAEMGKKQQALASVNKSLALATEIGARDLIKNAYEKRSTINAMFGNYEAAYNDHVRYKAEFDSLFNQEKEQKLTELRMQHEFSKKEAVIKVEQEKKDRINEAALLSHKRERIFYIILASLFLISIVALWSRLNFARKAKLLLEEKNEQIRAEKEIAEQQRVRAELMDMRHKIAKDLHDDIGSSLSSISIFSEVARKMTSETAPEAAKLLDNVGDIAQKAMENMSDIVWTINPTNDKLEDILNRINVMAGQLEEAGNIKVHFSIPEDVRQVSLTMHQRKHLYLIFKEAMNNVAKYSMAKNCYVNFEKTIGQIFVSIKDDGLGFEQKSATLGGNGLINMHQRAKEMNGSFEINSSKNNGTEINFSFVS